MMIQWYEPLSLTEWFKRVFSFLNIVILVITFGFVFSEFRYNWCEGVIGSYLALTNSTRPETGTIWETGDKTSIANNNLKEIIDKQRDTKQHALKSTSFMELASGVQPGEWINLDKEHFKKMYLKLPDFAANRLIPSVKLLFLLNNPKLDRIFIEGHGGRDLKIFFLNSDNLVLESIEINQEIFETPEMGNKFVVDASLDDFEQFKNRIYPASQFFKAMMDLSFDKINDLIEGPNILLEKEGKIIRAGIWNETESGYIKLGFEYKHNEKTNVLIVNGREWAVWELVINLKGSNI
ncbi:MAG: hypothetical protein KAI40_09375 [Desulfobacterales bacterium]|nr:hypothetical protein [Desulfobacterales bacterium]